MIEYNGVNHLAMATGNMDETIRFWRDLLGMRLVTGLGKPGYRHYFFQISETDLMAFFEWPELAPIEEKEHGRPVTGPFAFDHVSIGVKKQEDLWEIKDRLTAAGVYVSEPIDHGFIHSIYAWDPNGIAIEFSWSVDAVNIRRHPKMMDVRPSEAAQQGPEPQAGVWPPVTEPTLPKDRKVYPGAGSELFHDIKKQEV
jgi:catechol 2,3-dioxygenase-like lactoylglutathione lyase family enzyme